MFMFLSLGWAFGGAVGCSLLSSSAPVVPRVTPAVALVGHVAVDDLRLTVFNDGDTEWTDVVATVNGTVPCRLGVVHPHDQAGINFGSCSGTPLSEPVAGVKVTAAQGFFEAGESIPTVADLPVSGEPPVEPADAAPAQRPTTRGTSEAGGTGVSPASTGATTTSTPAATATAAPSADSALSLTAAISGGIGPARRLTVFNNGSSQWTGCVVTANDAYTFNVGTLSAGDHDGIMMIKFKDKNGNLFTSTAQVTRARIRCDQGTGFATPS